MRTKLTADQCPKIEHHAHPSAGSEGALLSLCMLYQIVSQKRGIASPLIANTKMILLDLLFDKADARLKTDGVIN